MVLIDMEMPDKCLSCIFLEGDSFDGYECAAQRRFFSHGVEDNWKPDWCPLKKSPELTTEKLMKMWDLMWDMFIEQLDKKICERQEGKSEEKQA